MQSPAGQIHTYHESEQQLCMTATLARVGPLSIDFGDLGHVGCSTDCDRDGNLPSRREGPNCDIRSFDVADCLLVDGASKAKLSPTAQRLYDASTPFGPFGSDGTNSEDFWKSANARCRSFFRSYEMPRL